jgi:hypothetical protein
MCAVGEEGTPSARMPLPSLTGKRRLLAKSGWQREWQLCQQHRVKLLANPAGQGCWQRSPALPTTLTQAVGKAGRVLQGKPIFANSLAQSCWQSWEGW